MGGVNGLSGRLTYDGDDGQTTVGWVVAALEISMEVRGWRGTRQGEDGQASIAVLYRHSWSHAYCVG